MRRLGYKADGIYCWNGHPIFVPDHILKLLWLDDRPPCKTVRIDLFALL